MGNLEKKKTIKELEKLAAEVLQLKQEREQRRPLLIEFCGSPKSGKSTTINSLNLFLKRNGFNTVVLTERAGICPIDNKTHPFFNLWTLTSAVSEIVKHLDLGKGKIDIIISDRGIFDALCWFEWLNTNPKAEAPYLDDKAYEDLRHFILMDMWKDYMDLIYVFKVSPDTSIKREYANLLTEKRGSIMQEPVLRGFNIATESIIKQYSKEFREVIEINTDTSETDNDPNAVSYFVTSAVLKNLKDLLIEKVGYFDSKFLRLLKNSVTKSVNLKDIKLNFDNRDKVEGSDCVQPIAIAVITNESRSKVLVVKKSSKRTSAHSPEREKLLLYIGGHVRKEDERSNILETIKQALHREIQEEINESISIQNSIPFLIYTPDSEISKKHVAFCFIIEMDLNDKKFKLVSDEFIMKTGTTKSGQILPVKEIVSGKYEMESWTVEILKEVFNKEVKKLPPSPELFDQ